LFAPKVSDTIVAKVVTLHRLAGHAALSLGVVFRRIMVGTAEPGA
jgi:hypothetical protein